MDNFREIKTNINALGEKLSEIEDSAAEVMPKVIEAVEETDAELTDRVEAQKKVTNQ